MRSLDIFDPRKYRVVKELIEVDMGPIRSMLPNKSKAAQYITYILANVAIYCLALTFVITTIQLILYP